MADLYNYCVFYCDGQGNVLYACDDIDADSLAQGWYWAFEDGGEPDGPYHTYGLAEAVAEAEIENALAEETY